MNGWLKERETKVEREEIKNEWLNEWKNGRQKERNDEWKTQE